MFERALVIEYLSQSRNKTISRIRMKNSIFESHFRQMLLTWVTVCLMSNPFWPYGPLITFSGFLSARMPKALALLTPAFWLFFFVSEKVNFLTIQMLYH